MTETQENCEAIYAAEGYYGPHDLSPEERADALAVRLAEAEEALAEAVDLLAAEGYDTDPDYAEEWQTITAPLAASRKEQSE